MELFFILFACLGLTWIFKYGTILEGIRFYLCKFSFFKELFDCVLCLGFHAGWMLGVCVYSFNQNPLFFLIPFASAGFCSLMEEVFQYFETSNVTLLRQINSHNAATTPKAEESKLA